MNQPLIDLWTGIGIAIIIINIAIGVYIVYGSPVPEMTLGDNWGCGYVNMTAMNISTVRDCYRD